MRTRDREPWYETDNPDRFARAAGVRVGVWVVVAVVFFGLLGVGVWAFKVATSDVKGQGDATRTKNSAANRIAAQERFEQLAADVKAADQKVGVFREQLKSSPSDPTLRTQYTGAQTYCIQQREDYAANAGKYTQQEFRSYDLPAQLDPADPAYDCR